MGPSSISNPFSPFSFFGTGAHKLHFSNHFWPLTKSFSLGDHLHFSPVEHLSMTHSGMPTHVQNYQIIFMCYLFSDIVHVKYLVFMCAGTWSSHTRVAPSGI
jgi:hypothetical protein